MLPTAMPKPSDPTAETIAKAIADRLKARRDELEWSATDVQEHGGPTYHTVLKTEAGQLPKLPLLERHVATLWVMSPVRHQVTTYRGNDLQTLPSITTKRFPSSGYEPKESRNAVIGMWHNR